MRTPCWLALPVLIGVAGCQPPDQTQAGQPATFTTSEVTAGLDLPFSEVARQDDLLFLSGMVGIEPGTTELVDGGFEAEARRALANVRLMLDEVGAEPADVLRCTVMLEDMANFERFNAVFTDFFDDPLPARSTFGVDGLALGAAVEIECVAAAPSRETLP